MANLPKDYSGVNMAMKQNGIVNKTINNLRLAVRDKWERSTETKPIVTNAEQTLNTMFKKGTGIFGYCGKQGNKKESCLKRPMWRK
jgi:hypothetical protein